MCFHSRLKHDQQCVTSCRADGRLFHRDKLWNMTLHCLADVCKLGKWIHPVEANMFHWVAELV